jgi:uncharacterized protein
MEFEWDEAKDTENRAKHGLGLADAARLEWTRARYQVDLRFDYGEERVTAYAMRGVRLYVCIYTLRGSVARIISLRKANVREIRKYGPQTENPAD